MLLRPARYVQNVGLQLVLMRKSVKEQKMLSAISTSAHGARLHRHLCRGTHELLTDRSLAFRHIDVSFLPFLFLFVLELPFLAPPGDQRVCAARDLQCEVQCEIKEQCIILFFRFIKEVHMHDDTYLFPSFNYMV
jgi:hypothetical protein